MNISGLTTAASIWSSSAIGILVGIGFYAAAILLTFLSAAVMMWAAILEKALPSRLAVAIRMAFRPGFVPNMSVLQRVSLERGYKIANGSLHIQCTDDREEWRFVVISLNKKKVVPISELSQELRRFDGVKEYSLSHARN